MSGKPMPEGEPLSDEELRALPEGTPIVVHWPGGNGPHHYVLTFDEWGQPYSWAKDIDRNGRLRFYNPLDFVGSQRFHTRVWASVGDTGKGEGA